MAGATGTAEDVESGLFDRLRSLPMPRGSAVAGRVVADTTMLAWSLLATTGIGFADHQPITVMVDATRSLTEGSAARALLGHSATYYVTGSLLWSAALVAVFAPLAILRYRRG